MRGWAAVLVTVLATVLVAGCGAGTPPDQAVRESVGELAAAGSARVGTEAATQVGAQRVAVPGDGEIDFEKRGYAYGLSLPGLGPVRAVGLGGVSYLRSERLAAGLPGTKPWLLLDPARLAAAGPEAAELTQTVDDPFGQIALVAGAGPDTRVVGPDTVDGGPVTHYATTVDFARARRGTPDPAAAGALDRYARKVGAPTLPADVWVDDDGRLRKLALTLPGSGRSSSVDTLTFSALGEPVTTVVAPPPDQVTDLAELLTRPGG